MFLGVYAANQRPRFINDMNGLTLREDTPVGECWQGSLIPLTEGGHTSGWVLTGFSYTSDSEGGHQWVSADRVLLYLWLWGRTHQWVSADRVLLYLWLWGRTSVGECWQGSLIPLTLREDTPVGECWQGSLIPLTLREDTSGWVLTGFSYTSDSKGGHTSGWVLTGFSYTSDSEGGHQWVSADSVLLYLWLWGTTPVGECWQGSLIPLTLREDTSGWVLTGFSYTSDSEGGHQWVSADSVLLYLWLWGTTPVGECWQGSLIPLTLREDTSGWVLTRFSYTSDSEVGHQWVSADRVLLYLWLWGRTPVGECWQGSLIPLTLREDTSGWVLTGFSYTSHSEGGHQWVSADRVLLYLWLWGRTPVGECWQGSLIPLTLRDDTSGWVLTGFSYTSDSEGRHQWVSADRVLLYLWLWGTTPVGECWQGSLIPLTLR